MGIEAAFNGIADLDPTLPAGTDQQSQGDDHIRGIKNCLVSDLPNITGAITATQTELNYLDGTTPGTAVASKALAVDGSKNLIGLGSVTATAFNGLLTGNVTGNVTGNLTGIVNTGSSIHSDVTATTQSAGDDSKKVATTEYVDQLFGTKTFTSAQFALTSGSGLSAVNHGLGGTPDVIYVRAECITSDSPFAVGDVVNVTPSDFRDAGDPRGCQVTATATQVSAIVATNSVWFLNKNTGAQFNPTNSSWRLRVKAIKF
jgi:hypothetical protein